MVFDCHVKSSIVASSIGSKIEGWSFSGLLTRVVGHTRISSEGNGRSRSL